MERKFKKKIALLLAAILVVTTSAIGFMAYADSTIVCTINQYNFPDANFRAVVSDWYDDNGDGYLSSDEVTTRSMTLSFMVDDTCGEGAKIESLQGIEFFGSLERLRASGLGIKTLDVSRLPKLIELTVQGNEIEKLDLMNCANLEILNCSDNCLTTLNLTNNSKLTKISAYVNSIESIIFNSNAGAVVKQLYIHQNELTSLDVSALTALEQFNCSHNHLLSLDLSKNTQLENVTDATIGSQTATAKARIDKGNIYVYFPLPDWNSRVVATSLDRTITSDEAGTYTQLGYDGVDFTPQDCDDIVDGITYYYDVGLADAENMDVNIEVERDFWQVKYFTDADKTTLFKKEIVYTGNDATEPKDIQIPQCKKFVMWSGRSDNITSDKEIYAIWADDHDIVPTKYEGGLFFFDCTKCQNQKNEYDFELFVNMRDDNEYFAPILDQNNDGIINAKDYAILKNKLK